MTGVNCPATTLDGTDDGNEGFLVSHGSKSVVTPMYGIPRLYGRTSRLLHNGNILTIAKSKFNAVYYRALCH